MNKIINFLFNEIPFQGKQISIFLAWDKERNQVLNFKITKKKNDLDFAQQIRLYESLFKKKRNLSTPSRSKY